MANRLAYYQARSGPGVLAPAGWYCFGTYGSSGSAIFVSPRPINDKLLFSIGWKGLKGEAIEVSESFGGTSGRWAVASMIARIFPEYRGFITAVQSMGFDPSTTTFASGPYATDTLNYLNPYTVEYTTPAHLAGVGTMSGLAVDSLDITGVQIITGADTDLLSLSLRLAPASSSFARMITNQVEREYTKSPHKH